MNTITVDVTPVTPSGMPGAEFSLTLQGESGGVAPEWPGAVLGLGPDAVIIGAPFQRATFWTSLQPVDASGVLLPAPEPTVVSSQ
jgi:hypothetical protein